MWDQVLTAVLRQLPAVITGLVLVGVSALVTWVLTMRHSRKIGELRRARLSVSLFRLELIPKKDVNELVFALGDRIRHAHDKAFCVVRFEVSNIGDLTARDVRLRIAWPVALREAVENAELKYSAVGVSSEADFKHGTQADPPYYYTTHSIPSLDPHDAFRVDELVEVAHASELPMDIEAEDADGLPIKVRLVVRLSMLPVVVTIRALDQPPETAFFTVRSYNVGTIGEIRTALNAKIPEGWFHAKSGSWVTSLVLRPNLEEEPKPPDVRDIEWSVFRQVKDDLKAWVLTRWQPTKQIDEAADSRSTHVED